MSNKVFIAFQDTEEARPIVEAIEQDNDNVVVDYQPAMVRIESPNRLVIKRETVESIVGRAWDLQEIHLSVISLAGNLDEDDDQFVLAWNL